jgi:hypothetical protein
MGALLRAVGKVETVASFPWFGVLLFLGSIIGGVITWQCKRYRLWAIVSNQRAPLYASKSEDDVSEARGVLQEHLSQ